ncbi:MULTISPECIES: zf-HC2 domain-containing protein [Streptomyces]|uniref:zf-HC2 domain-containing protein n=1 Tax=Streptomyces TaxID=1883 RepID=UPI0005177DFE|nr:MULTISPECIES: zf-HC2 domain-containing protein [Streptomyces]MDX2918587.1 zf-HC2 domain-containing protein [Streptomyces sp. NE06-03C]MDX3606718.1 zf-HC2 domain-containing protein [Streptomyces sp. FL06-04B]MDX3739058.1 zf-HC2 domain-containing protein [Streptomyces sp. ID01-15D]
MNGDGRESEGGEEEVRGARRIPGPRGAADDLDLASVPLPPLPPPGGTAPDDAVPEQAAPRTEPERGPEPEPAVAEPDPEPGPEPEPAVAEPDPEPGPAAVAWPEPGPEPDSEPADGAPEPPDEPDPLVSSAPVVLPHQVLKALLGAWALSACSAEETAAVEDHLTGCAPCADEALRLRDAVGLLHTDGSLDLDPTLRTRVLDGCFGRRPARIPVPEWAAPYDAETARLDALLRDIGDSEWHAPVRLRWFEEERQVSRRTTVAGVIGHLMAVDGLLSAALGLDDPLDGGRVPLDPTERTETYWSATCRPPTRAVREPWRAQSHELIRTASFAGRNAAETSVSYGAFALPFQDAALDRAFECWVHGGDIADAVDYPYPVPSAAHLHRMIDLAARMLPAALAGRRSAGLAPPAKDLVTAGAPGRSLHLEIEGHGGGDWYIALDSPAALGAPERAVAQVALDGVEFCRLVAGHISPVEAAAGQEGDREAIRDVLCAAASLSRL